jgi:hypothetical protein
VSAARARRIPGVECYAETTYRSADGSYREYTLYDRNLDRIGRVRSVSKRNIRSAGYRRIGAAGIDAQWPTLAAAAEALDLEP